MLGSGQFGGVQIGIWNGSNGKCEVAVKTLNPTVTQPDAKVKFLQEAAIMAQFRHPNVIQLYGIVTDGEPVGDFENIMNAPFTCIYSIDAKTI